MRCYVVTLLVALLATTNTTGLCCQDANSRPRTVEVPVTVVLLDEKQKPIPNGQVIIEHLQKKGVVKKGWTNEHGIFTTTLCTGDIQFTVWAVGYVPFKGTQNLPGELELRVTLPKEPPPKNLKSA